MKKVFALNFCSICLFFDSFAQYCLLKNIAMAESTVPLCGQYCPLKPKPLENLHI